MSSEDLLLKTPEKMISETASNLIHLILTSSWDAKDSLHVYFGSDLVATSRLAG